MDDLIARLTEWSLRMAGYASEREIMETFGGIPRLSNTFVGESTQANGQTYFFLGQYRKAFRKVREAAENNEYEVVFERGDLGETGLFALGELQQIKENGKREGRNFLTKKMELGIGYSFI